MIYKKKTVLYPNLQFRLLLVRGATMNEGQAQSGSTLQEY